MLKLEWLPPRGTAKYVPSCSAFGLRATGARPAPALQSRGRNKHGALRGEQWQRYLAQLVESADPPWVRREAESGEDSTALVRWGREGRGGPRHGGVTLIEAARSGVVLGGAATCSK
ncbi:MAG TPA: hypothetical protein VGK73_28030 [Polyangiaceae bacterium]